MANPGESRIHRWRRQCAPGRFVSIDWDPGDGTAPIDARLAIEHDDDMPLLERITLAWRTLTWASVTARLEVRLDGSVAREIADVLSDFADDADSVWEAP